MWQESDNELEILKHVEIIKKHDPGNWFSLHHVHLSSRSATVQLQSDYQVLVWEETPDRYNVQTGKNPEPC